jgi:hypothetical protein
MLRAKVLKLLTGAAAVTVIAFGVAYAQQGVSWGRRGGRAIGGTA